MKNLQKSFILFSLVITLAWCSRITPEKLQYNTWDTIGAAETISWDVEAVSWDATTISWDVEVSNWDVEVLSWATATNNSYNENTSQGDLSEKQSMDIEKTNIKLLYPKSCNIKKNENEPNRRWSFVSYNFNCTPENTKATIQEMQFFNKESIWTFEEKCSKESKEGWTCFMGVYPTLKSYNEQLTAFRDKAPTSEMRKIWSLYYIVSQYPVGSEIWEIREYTTFIDDTKVDILVYMSDKGDIAFADELIQWLNLRK